MADRIDLDQSGIRPPTGGASGNVNYGDAASILAALQATDGEYAALIQNTISLIQELQAEVEAGAISASEGNAEIANLQAQLDDLIGTDGAIQLLIGAIESASQGTFSTEGATFCSLATGDDSPTDENPNVGGSAGSGERIGNVRTAGGGDSSSLVNPFTEDAVANLCATLTTLNDAVLTQQDFALAGYTDSSQVTAALTAQYQAGQAAGYGAGYETAVADIISEGFNYPTTEDAYGAGYSAAEEAILNLGDYVSTQDAYTSGIADAVNQLNDTSYQGGAETTIQAAYDAIYELGLAAGTGGVTWTNPDTEVTYTGQEAVTQSSLYGYGLGEDAGYDVGYGVGATDALGDYSSVEDAYNTGYDAGETSGYTNGYTNGYNTGIEQGVINSIIEANAIATGIGANDSGETLNAVLLNIYNQGVIDGESNITPASSVTYTATNGTTYTGQEAVTQAEIDGFNAGAASVIPEDGIGQADVDAAVAQAESDAQAILDDVIIQLNAANESNVEYGEFIEALTGELDILEEFLTAYYDYSPDAATEDEIFRIPSGVSGTEGYESYFSGEGYKMINPQRLVNMNNAYMNFAGEIQARNQRAATSAQPESPVENDGVNLELTSTAKTALYVLGGGALAFLAFKLFKKK